MDVDLDPVGTRTAWVRAVETLVEHVGDDATAELWGGLAPLIVHQTRDDERHGGLDHRLEGRGRRVERSVVPGSLDHALHELRTGDRELQRRDRDRQRPVRAKVRRQRLDRLQRRQEIRRQRRLLQPRIVALPRLLSQRGNVGHAVWKNRITHQAKNPLGMVVEFR